MNDETATPERQGDTENGEYCLRPGDREKARALIEQLRVVVAADAKAKNYYTHGLTHEELRAALDLLERYAPRGGKE